MKFFLVALLLATSWIARLPAQEERNALQIFDAMLARMEERSAALKKVQYRQRLITHQFEADGTMVGKAEWRSIVRPGEKDPVEYIFESKEGKVTFVEDKPEGGKSGKGEKDRGDEAKDGKDQPGSIAAAVKKYNLRERFVWKRLADATVAGERAYVLSFEPRPGMAAKGREEKFLGQLGGTITVSQADYSVLKATAALQAPYRLFWIIARITEMRLTYDAAPGRGGDRLLRPIRAEAFTTVTFPFHSVRQRHWLTADQFGPRTPRGTSAKK